MSSTRSFQFALATLSLAAIAALGACGGSDEPAAPIPVAAPAITAQPADVAVGEGGNTAFTVAATGTGPRAFAWLNANDSSPVPGATAATFSGSGASLADSGKAFKARVSNSGGEALSANATLTVNERTWSDRFDVAGYARNAAAVVDSHGHTHLLTMNGNSAASDVMAHIKLKLADSTQANTLALAASLQETAGLTDPTTAIAAAANASGHVMAVWHRNGLVGAALYTPNGNPALQGSWQLLPTRISSFTTGSARDPAVAAVGNAGFEFVWREQTGSSEQYDIMARHYTIAGNTLDPIVNIESSNQDTQAPRIVADAAGNLLAAWRFAGAGVVLNRRLSGAAWSTATTVVETNTAQVLEQLKANAAGTAVLLTSDRVGYAWSHVLDLAATNPLLGTGAANAYGSAPDAHVHADGSIDVFGVSVSSTSRLFQWHYAPGSGWGSASPVSAVSNADFIATGLGVRNPFVAGADAAGNLSVVWEVRDATSGNLGRIEARRFHAGLNAWRAIAPVAAVSGTDHRAPIATVAADGSATAVFRNIVSGGFGAANFR